MINNINALSASERENKAPEAKLVKRSGCGLTGNEEWCWIPHLHARIMLTAGRGEGGCHDRGEWGTEDGGWGMGDGGWGE